MSAIGHVEEVAPGASHEPEGTICKVPVAEGYTRWAASYDDAPNPLLAREERYLSPLLVDLHGRSVLDLACGTGRWLERLVLRGCDSAVGVDLSLAMLRIANKKDALRGRLTQALGENLPLPGAAFDLAMCSFALGHVQELGTLARELKRVTSVGADVFVSDLHPEAHKRGWRVGFRDCGGEVQIETQSRSAQHIVRTFSSNEFSCLACLPLWLGEPEEPIFARAGKSMLFVSACQLPAILICHFRRVGAPGERTAG